MGAREKNPFETLGITPELAARLDEKDLFTLVKTLYRSLLKIYHPDRSKARSSKSAPKDATRAVELNLAYERLNLDKDSESFRHCHKAYSARRKRGLSKKIADLQKEIDRRDDDQSALADCFMEYLLRGLPWKQEAEGDICRFPICPSNIKLGLNDVAINQNVRAMSWSLGSNYKEIIFDALGGMYYRPVGRSKPFAANYIHILGIIDTKDLDLLPLLNRVPPREGFFKSPALDSRYGIDGAPLQVLNSISMEKFKSHCLPLLKPDLAERSYLFSIHRPVFESEGSVSVEGVIVKISKP